MSIISISGKKHSGKDTIAYMWMKIVHEERTGNNYDLSDWLDNPTHGGAGWEIRKWATKLKQVAALILGIDPEKFEDPEFKKQKMYKRWGRYALKEGDETIELFVSEKEAYEELAKWDGNLRVAYEIPTYRQFLQEIGTEAFRDVIHPNTWVNALMTEYEQNIEQEVISGVSSLNSGEVDTIYPQWLITDTRFPNEFQAVEDAPGQTYNIRITRKTELRFPELWNEFNGSDYQDWEEFLKAREMYKTVYHSSETALDGRGDWDYVITNNGTLKQLFQKVKILKETVLKI